MDVFHWLCTILKTFSDFLTRVVNNWYERQIETFSNVASIYSSHSGNDLGETLSTIIWKSESLHQLQDKISTDRNNCKDQLLMVYCMFEEMGLMQETAQQCLKLLVETENIPSSYIRTLCFLWHKYKIYTYMQDDLFNAPFLIHQNKMSIYNLFRYQLKPLLGINEEKDIILKEYYKHQADITRSLELAYLTETRNLFDNTHILDNDELFNIQKGTLVGTPREIPDSNESMSISEDKEINKSSTTKTSTKKLVCLP